MSSKVLPQVIGVKVEIRAEMKAQGVTQAELARRLRWYPMEVTRVLDPEYPSTLAKLEAALQALGCHLEVEAVRVKSGSLHA